MSDSGAGAFEAALAATDDGFVVAWYDVRDGNAEIYARLLDSDGRPLEPERRLTNDPGASYEADIQAAGQDLVVAWYDKSDNGRLQAQVGVWSRDGTPRWSRAISAADRNGRNPALAVRGSELFIAWMEDSEPDRSDVWAGWWDVSGQPLGGPVLIGAAGRTTWNLNVDIDASGRGWIAFDAAVGTQSEELFIARVEPRSADAAVRLQRLTEDDGKASKYPDIAVSGDVAAISWHDTRDGNEEVYLAVVAVDAVLRSGAGRAGSARVEEAPTAWSGDGVEAIARRITDTPGSSIGAYLAWNRDLLGLAWCDDSDGNQHDIYFQTFGRDGAPRAEARRLTENATSSLVPSIRAAHGGFALAWNEYEAPAGDGHGSTGRSEIAFTVVR